MIPYKQLSLADIFQDCQNKFNNDKPAFLSLLETHNVIYCVRHHCFLSISIHPQQNLFFSPKRKFCTNHSI